MAGVGMLVAMPVEIQAHARQRQWQGTADEARRRRQPLRQHVRQGDEQIRLRNHFQRRLVMQGDTELGLAVKNFLDSLDADSLAAYGVFENALRRLVPLYQRLFS